MSCHKHPSEYHEKLFWSKLKLLNDYPDLAKESVDNFLRTGRLGIEGHPMFDKYCGEANEECLEYCRQKGIAC